MHIINSYLKLLSETANDAFAFNTFFYTKVLSCGFNTVCQWIHEGIFRKRLLLFPIHLNIHIHLVDITKYPICYFDSLKKSNPVCLETIQNYLIRKSEHHAAEWEFVYPKNIPKQDNSSDCGVFVCMYARCMSLTSDFNFSQEEMLSIIRHLALELL